MARRLAWSAHRAGRRFPLSGPLRASHARPPEPVGRGADGPLARGGGRRRRRARVRRAGDGALGPPQRQRRRRSRAASGWERGASRVPRPGPCLRRLRRRHDAGVAPRSGDGRCALFRPCRQSRGRSPLGRGARRGDAPSRRLPGPRIGRPPARDSDHLGDDHRRWRSGECPRTALLQRNERLFRTGNRRSGAAGRHRLDRVRRAHRRDCAPVRGFPSGGSGGRRPVCAEPVRAGATGRASRRGSDRDPRRRRPDEALRPDGWLRAMLRRRAGAPGRRSTRFGSPERCSTPKAGWWWIGAHVSCAAMDDRCRTCSRRAAPPAASRARPPPAIFPATAS